MTKPRRTSPKRRKRKVQRISRKSVVKMLTVMSESGEEGQNLEDDFLTTGRTGRRNALPDIMGEHSLTTTADLPERMTKLTTKDCQQPSTSTDASMDASECGKDKETKDLSMR